MFFFKAQQFKTAFKKCKTTGLIQPDIKNLFSFLREKITLYIGRKYHLKLTNS